MMSKPFSDPSFDEDLHELMAVAILAAQRGVETDTTSIYDTWSLSYPTDALGKVGQGLCLIGAGHSKEGYELIEEAAKTAQTRQDQAQEVLKSLKEDLASLDA